MQMEDEDGEEDEEEDELDGPNDPLKSSLPSFQPYLSSVKLFLILLIGDPIS
jgi:hypothetical protein